MWGADNYGAVYLNGTQINSIAFGYGAFQTLAAYNGAAATFNARANLLTFVVFNGVPNQPSAAPGPAAFRATVNVTATVVPLHAGLPLLAGALGLLGLGAARRRRNARA